MSHYEFEGTGKLFVTAGDNDNYHRFQGAKFESAEPALVFPIEEGAIHDYWYATINPVGVFAVNTAGAWSISVVRKSPEEKIYVLKDVHGVFAEVRWGFAHHAIFYKDWADYRLNQKLFLENVSILKNCILSLIHNCNNHLRFDNEVRVRVNEFAAKSDVRLFGWIEVSAPQDKTLQWAESRLREMEKEYNEYFNLSNAEMNKQNL